MAGAAAAGAGAALVFLIAAALGGACFAFGAGRAGFGAACFGAAGFDFAAVFWMEPFAGATFLAAAGLLAVVGLKTDLAGEAFFPTFLKPVCFDAVLGFEADPLGAPEALAFLTVALIGDDAAFPVVVFFADGCTFLFAAFVVGALALALAVAEFLLDDVFAFGDAIFMPGVFAFDVAGLLAVDLGFEAVPDLGLDVAAFLPAGLAVFLLAILLVDFAFGDTALPPAAFPLFFVRALVVD